MAHQRANQWEDEEPRTPPKDWLDELALWYDNLDVPPLTKWQRVLVYSVLFIFVLVIITSFTGHFYIVALAFARAVDGLPLPALTLIVGAVVALLEVAGVNTTLLALAVGYIYGRRYHSVFIATLYASCVAFGAVVAGCLAAYALGMTALKGWALELASRNPTFAALDCVLERKGLLVNVLLRLTMPDSLINFTMACSKCPFWAFVVAMLAMMPWIIAHAWYGAQIESLTDKVGSSEQDLVDLIVGAVAITLLATVLTVYTKKMLEELLAEQAAADTAVGGSGGGGSADSAGERRAGSGALTSAGDSYNDDDYSAASTEMRCGRSHLGSV